MTLRTVHLQFGRFVHPVYREQLHAVPGGWRYSSDHPSLTAAATPTKLVVESSTRFAAAKGIAETVALRVASEAGYVHRIRAGAAGDATIIHSAERLIRDSPLPYVLDFEHAALFTLYQPAALERPWARRVLERALADDRLRFLLGWSDAACRSLVGLLSPAARAVVEPKLRAVTPAIRLAVDRPHVRGTGPLRLLFVGTKFYEKGAIEAVLALREARRTDDVTLDLLTYTPAEWQGRLGNEPGLTLHAPGGTDVVRRLYERSDALLFPSHMDTFGYVVLEAMAHGLPVIAPSHLALRETIDDGVSGLLFGSENMLYGDDAALRFRHVLPPPKSYLTALRHPSDSYVAGVADAIRRLASEPGLHGRLAEGAFEVVRTGSLSIERRRAALSEIYAAAA
ncbi:MAG: hypothetical protein JWP18_680 [Solirubrobacterales bacterium]|nr:hypothetical protein [Solirubrobacterales bacterium]